MTSPRFATVVLDVDSTLAGIEGIDWLAARKGGALAREVAELTTAAMDGRVAIDAVYASRVLAVAPSAADIAALSEAYQHAVAPGAAQCIHALAVAGVRVVLLSGGFREAIQPMARAIGIHDDDVHAVSVQVAANGAFAGFDAASPLTQSQGKRRILESLAGQLPRPIVHVGDGITDLEARPAVDAFAAYVGFVTRDAVVARADFVVPSFADLESLVLARG